MAKGYWYLSVTVNKIHASLSCSWRNDVDWLEYGMVQSEPLCLFRLHTQDYANVFERTTTREERKGEFRWSRLKAYLLSHTAQ